MVALIVDTSSLRKTNDQVVSWYNEIHEVLIETQTLCGLRQLLKLHKPQFPPLTGLLQGLDEGVHAMH